MKTLFKTKPVLSFMLLTFAITYFFWFLPVIITFPKDIRFAILIIGGGGPLIASYIITVMNSGAKFKIDSKPVFIIVFIASALAFFLRMYFVNKGLNDRDGLIPELNEVGPVCYVLFAVAFFIFGLNASNATNKALKENHIKTFLFSKYKIKWYLIGLLLWPVVALISYYIGDILNLETTEYAVKFKPVWFIGFFSTFFLFGGLEEFGWRGFLQKELQKRYNPFITVLIINIIWSFWHLPHYYNGAYSTGGFIDFLPRLINTIPIAIIFTWFYNKSSYDLLSAVLLHSMYSNYAFVFGHGVFTEVLFLLCIYCFIDDKMWKKKDYLLLWQSHDYEKIKNNKTTTT